MVGFLVLLYGFTNVKFKELGFEIYWLKVGDAIISRADRKWEKPEQSPTSSQDAEKWRK